MDKYHGRRSGVSDMPLNFSELSYCVNYIPLHSKLITGRSLTCTILWMPSHDYSNGLFMYRVVSCPITRSISRTIAPLLCHCDLCTWHSVLQVRCVGYSGGMLMDNSLFTVVHFVVIIDCDIALSPKGMQICLQTTCRHSLASSRELWSHLTGIYGRLLSCYWIQYESV